MINDIAAKLGIPQEKLLALVARGILPGGQASPRTPLEFDEASLAQAQHTLAELKWLQIITPENWERLSREGLSYTLFSSRQRAWVELMRPGHQILFYVTRYSVFAGWATVSAVRKARTVLWPSGAYSDVVPLSPLLVVGPSAGVKIAPMVPDLAFIRTKRNWAMTLRRTLIALTDGDFHRITRQFADAGLGIRG